MNFKKIISAALSAAITAGAMLAGTAFAAEPQTTNYDLSSHDTAASTEGQEVVISSEFTVHLNGNSDPAKADSISNGEINFYRAADKGSNTPTGYIVFTPTYSGTLALNLKASNVQRNQGLRLYAQKVDEVSEATLATCTKKNNETAAVYAGIKTSSAGSTEYLGEAINIMDIDANTAYTFNAGNTYILFPWTYNAAGTISVKDFTYTYTVPDEATPYDYTIDGGLANTDAKGFTAEFNVGESVVNSFTWYLKKNEGDWKKLTDLTQDELTEISGTTTIKVGLVVYDIPTDEITASDTISAGYTYR